ncbi:hypothetical protein AAG906_005874 [Vitis piasezkii]
MVNSGLEIPNADAAHANAFHASVDVDMSGASAEDQTEQIGWKPTGLHKAGGPEAAPLPAIFIGENLESPNCLWIGIIAYRHPEHDVEAFDGLGISLLLTINPTIQYTKFDQLKRRRLERNKNITEKSSSTETLSAISVFMLGAMSKSIVNNLV